MRVGPATRIHGCSALERRLSGVTVQSPAFGTAEVSGARIAEEALPNRAFTFKVGTIYDTTETLNP